MVVHDHGVTTPHEAAGDVAAHAAQPDDADLHGGSPLRRDA
jgi:hypothetical protein